MNASITKYGRTVEYDLNSSERATLDAIKLININKEEAMGEPSILFGGCGRKIAVFGDAPPQVVFNECAALINLNKAKKQTMEQIEKDEKKVKPAIEKLKQSITNVFTMCYLSDIEEVMSHLELERKNNLGRLQTEELNKITQEEKILKDGLELLAAKRRKLLGVTDSKVTETGKHSRKEAIKSREEFQGYVDRNLVTSKQIGREVGCTVATVQKCAKKFKIPFRGGRCDREYLKTSEQTNMEPRVSKEDVSVLTTEPTTKVESLTPTQEQPSSVVIDPKGIIQCSSLDEMEKKSGVSSLIMDGYTHLDEHPFEETPHE